MAEMNQSFLGHQGTTDVITFSYLTDESFPIDDAEETAGEVFVCPAVAVSAAQSYEQPLDAEIILYCIHGLLHLSGLDDHSDEERRQMRAAEAEVMAIVQSVIEEAPLFKAAI